MALEVQAISDVGKLRKANEDCYITEPSLGFYAVADGMGGQAAGDVASRLAIDAIHQFIQLSYEQQDITWPTHYEPSFTHSENRLLAAISLANLDICRTAADDAGLHGMGTTVVCALVEGDKVTLAHAGDSRAYHIRKGKLEQITRDHSWVNEQLDQGLLTADQAKDHPYRNIVTRALGASREANAELNKLTLHPGELLLLCTDGLTTMVTDSEIEEIIERFGDDLSSCLNALVFEANKNGGLDNITIILMRYSKD